MNKRMFFLGTVWISMLFPLISRAQDFSSYHLSFEYNYLYSTHKTKFTGTSILFDKDLSVKWNVGIGFGWNTCPFHLDNNLDLKKLKLLPIFLSGKYFILKKERWEPFFLLKTGITIMRYEQRPTDLVLWKEGKSPDENPTPYKKMKDLGWYAYFGTGTNYNFSKKFQAYVNIGLIGYKMSFNDLDINPHGIASNIGLIVKI